MKNYAIFDEATGRCLQTCGAVDLAHAQTAAAPWQVAVEVDESFVGLHAYLDAGVVCHRLPAPGPHHTFDWAAKAWIDPRTLQQRKALKNDEINDARERANYTSFPYSGKVIVSDLLSRGDIETTNGYISLYGTIPPNWPGGWKTQDNSYVAIPDVAAWKAFYSAMFAQGNANFARAQQLKGQLAAATTAEQIDAITWDSHA